MSNLRILILISIVLLLPHSTGSTTPPTCKRYCGSPELAIEFPFQLTQNYTTSVERDARCGYKGFEVSCNKRNQSLIKLPDAGEFVVKNIFLETQYVWINDPDECLAKRFLQKIDLRDSPFGWGLHNFDRVIFYNCTESPGKSVVDPQLRIPCLSDEKNSVVVILDSDVQHWRIYNSSCRNIGSASVPVKDFSKESRQIRNELLGFDIILQWFIPSCYCKADQHCGFLSDTGSDVICYDNNQGESPLTPAYVIGKEVFIACGIICAFLFLSWALLSGREERRIQQQRIRRSIRNQQQRERRRRMEYNIELPPVVGVGIDDGSMIDIERCPKIQLGESGQLPKSIDNVCSICLSEYEPKETLRSMPQCNHYFHAHCIDAWLRMNASCPLCRKLPQGSALVTSLHSSS